MTVIEFWPDYGPGPLWLDGHPVDPEELGLSAALASRLQEWNASHKESRVPVEVDGDAEWIAEGAELLRATREALARVAEVVVTEPWWEE
jgi:hypothetical protein